VKIVYLAPFAFSPKATVSARMLPIATALVRRGHRVHILMPPYDNPADSGKVWEYQGVQLENMALNPAPSALPFARATWDAGQYFWLAQRLIQRAHQLQPDALHVFKPVGPGALALWLHLLPFARRGPSVPRLIVDNDDWEGAGGWLDINPYPAPQKTVMAWQERWTLRHAHAITVASNALQERSHQLIRQFEISSFAPDIPIHILPNGPDEKLREEVAQAEAQRAELRARFGWGDAPILIYAGTVPHGHDMDIAVTAVRENAQRYPNLRWVIIATGDGLPTLRQAIEQAGIADRVMWHGFMPHRELVNYLVAADIALYPYRDSNINRAKCSGKVIDYMAAGRPMVVSDVGMNRVYLEDGVSGLLTPPDQPEVFVQGLSRLLGNRAFATAMGHAAQQRLWAWFSWQQRVEVLERLYSAPGSE